MKKLYEISAMVQYNIIIAAETKEEAMAEVFGWEDAWAAYGDFRGTFDVEIVDIREADQDCLDDLAHIVI